MRVQPLNDKKMTILDFCEPSIDKFTNHSNLNFKTQSVMNSETIYYKMIKSHFINSKSLVPVNSILVKTIKNRFNKRGNELKSEFECYCQGAEGKMSKASFDYLIENNLEMICDYPKFWFYIDSFNVPIARTRTIKLSALGKMASNSIWFSFPDKKIPF